MEEFENKPGVASQSKAEYVYQTLREKIENGSYPPGTPLSIREISLLLDVSRTPAKEAISRLAYEGYADLLPNRSAVVARISTTEVLELLELREALERSTAYYAAQRRTDNDLGEMDRIRGIHCRVSSENAQELAHWDKLFHLAIAKATYNNQLYETVARTFEKLTRISLPISSDRAAASFQQHDGIFDAIRKSDSDEAERLMKEHNRDILASIKAYQYQNIHLFK